MSQATIKRREQRRRQRNRGQLLIGSVPQSIRPGPYDPNVMVKLTRRYTNGTVGPITNCRAAGICESLGLTCTATNATAQATFGWFKIKRIKIWGVAPTPPGTTSVGLIWGYTNSANQANFTLNKEVRDISGSSAYVPYIEAVPPAGSLASFWQTQCDSAGARRTTDNDIIFSLNCAPGSIVEVDFEAVMFDAGRNTIRTATVISSGTASAYAYAPLDGVAGGYAPEGVDYFV